MQWTIPTNIDHDFVQSHSQSETTMVITATSAIKIWTMREQEEPTEISMPGSRAEGYPPSSGLSMKQMLTLLLFTTLLNFALAYSQALLNSWFWNKLATIWDNVHGLFPFSIFLAWSLGGLIYMHSSYSTEVVRWVVHLVGRFLGHWWPIPYFSMK